MKSPFPKRSVFRVMWSAKRKRWGVLAPGKYESGVNPLIEAKTQELAIEAGANICRNITKNKGTWTQLMIHDMKHAIESERTYPRSSDPKRFKG